MDIQKIMDLMQAEGQLHRAQTQMTLGELIAFLKGLPASQFIEGFTRPHSYRGYYSDLAFEPCEDKLMVKDLLAMVEPCLGRTFQGYKGGDFLMQKATPCWISYYGTTGNRLMGFAEGKFLTEPDE